MSTREKALALRKAGYSYSYISTKTGLSKSTLSYYLHDIPFVPNEVTIRLIGNARVQSAQTKARLKQDSFDKAKKMAKKDVGHINKRDLFMLGLGIYIGEGSKTQDIIRVVNTDYRVINLFIEWLCMMGYTRKNFSIRIHLYPDSKIREAESFWVTKTGLPYSQFQKVCIDQRINKDRKRNNKHIHGTAHVTVRSNGRKELGVVFSRRIGAWMEEVLE
jgi:transcriptional regulator with XRE-family HTH domain